MSLFRNHAPIQNQAGQQIFHGNVIFNDYGGPYKRPRANDRDADSETSLDEDILASLAFHHMSDRRRNVEAPHRRTCQWLFELDEYKAWRVKPHGLLWIKGLPGSGKSTLMSHLYSALWREQHDINLEFFFTARGAPLQREPLGMFRALLNQIFYQDPSTRSFMRELYREKTVSFGSGDSAWEWQLSELKTALTSIVSACAQNHRQIIIFIDALDEAGQQAARDMAHYFHTLSDHVSTQSGAVKICISCRHYPVPSTARAVEMHVERHNRGDIEAYIRDYLCLDDLSSNLVNQQEIWLKLLDDLVSMARGVFQWVRLIVPMVGHWMSDGYSLEVIRKRLTLVPEELRDVYKHIIENVIDENYRTQSLRLFQWVCLAIRPLSVTEMRHALAVLDIDTETKASPSKCHETAEFVTSDEVMKSRIKSWSGGLVEVVTYNVVQVIHQSVNEFLRADGFKLLLNLASWPLSARPCNQVAIEPLQAVQISHSALYLSCLNYLSSEFIKPFDPDKKIAHTSDPYGTLRRLKLPLFQYSVVCRFTHAQEAGAHRSQDLDHESRLLARSFSAQQFATNIFWSSYYITRPLQFEAETVLHLAAIAGLDDLVRYRIGRKDDIEVEAQNGWTALQYAVSQGHLSVAKILVDAGANLHKSTRPSETLLLLAARGSYTDLFSWLVARGSSADAQHDTYVAPLYTAAKNSCLAICKLCIGAGADVNARREDGDTALQAAVSSGSMEVVRLLLDAGAETNARKRNGATTLQVAAHSGSMGMVRLLLDAGADVNAPGYNQPGNALQTAAYIGSVDMVRLLLDAGADVNACGGYYHTAIRAATFGGSEEVLRVLLEAGADANADRGSCATPVRVAVVRGYTNIAEILRAAGAE